jgi:hypothetical protein
MLRDVLTGKAGLKRCAKGWGMSYTLLHQEHRRIRTKIKAKQGRMKRNMMRKNENRREVSISWLAAMSVYFKNIMAFKNVSKLDNAPK